MAKIKILLGLFILGAFISAKPALGADVYLSITQLPSYITSNNFKLSYSCLGCTSVQFSVSKNGSAFTDFGPATTEASGQIEVTSSQIDDQVTYIFRVSDVSGAEAKTETFYDISGPSPISGFYKDAIGDGVKLHWKNPGDSDFEKVVIYRGETSDFSADASHEIARIAGGVNAEMTYDDHVPDPAKTYYYALRALDRAGNSSSLVGDSGTVLGTATQVLGAGTGTAKTDTETIVVPSDKSQVLPESTAVSVEKSKESEGLINNVVTFAKNKTKLTVLILTGICLIGYLLYRKARKS